MTVIDVIFEMIAIAFVLALLTPPSQRHDASGYCGVQRKGAATLQAIAQELGARGVRTPAKAGLTAVGSLVKPGRYDSGRALRRATRG
jgi:hypothetical protein